MLAKKQHNPTIAIKYPINLGTTLDLKIVIPSRNTQVHNDLDISEGKVED